MPLLRAWHSACGYRVTRRHCGSGLCKLFSTCLALKVLEVKSEHMITLHETHATAAAC